MRVFCAPLDVVIHPLHRRYVLGALDIGLCYFDHDPSFQVSAVALDDVFEDCVTQYLLLGWMVLQECQEVFVLYYLSAAIYVETYLLAKVYEQETYMGIF